MSDFTLSVALETPHQITMLAHLAHIVKSEGYSPADPEYLYLFLNIIEDALNTSSNESFPPISGRSIYTFGDNFQWFNVRDACKNIAKLIDNHLARSVDNDHA